MKTVFLLCLAISAGFFLIGCADISKGPAAESANTGLPPGTSPGLSSGGGTGGGGFSAPKHIP
ncbi:MAG TPA: hypothetical protein VJ719_05110 [Chthoniobacterales bacterium]|nr:hypothetical protein [Chthoniobacterales bacterium]